MQTECTLCAFCSILFPNILIHFNLYGIAIKAFSIYWLFFVLFYFYFLFCEKPVEVYYVNFWIQEAHLGNKFPLSTYNLILSSSTLLSSLLILLKTKTNWAVAEKIEVGFAMFRYRSMKWENNIRVENIGQKN